MDLLVDAQTERLARRCQRPVVLLVRPREVGAPEADVVLVLPRGVGDDLFRGRLSEGVEQLGLVKGGLC